MSDKNSVENITLFYGSRFSFCLVNIKNLNNYSIYFVLFL